MQDPYKDKISKINGDSKRKLGKILAEIRNSDLKWDDKMKILGELSEMIKVKQKT